MIQLLATRWTRIPGVRSSSRARLGGMVVTRSTSLLRRAAARHVLSATAKRIREYAGRDARMRELVAELSAEAETFSTPMNPMQLKQAHYNSSLLARMRAPSGVALKSREPR